MRYPRRVCWWWLCGGEVSFAGRERPELGQRLTAGVLRQLRPLTQLTYLGLPFGEACSKDARLSFRASMPGLMRLDDDPCL
jgi:hypothetical protein